MRKFYALVAIFALQLVGLCAYAQMPEDNPTLKEMGYILSKNYDFVAGTVNGNDINPKNAFVAGETETSFKVNGYNPVRLANEGLESISLEFLADGINWPADRGLQSVKNERWINFHDLKEGQILVFDISNQDTIQFVVNSIACNGKTGWADTPAEPLIVEPISGTVHELQELAEEGSADTYRYFRVINDGTLCCKFNGKTTNYINSLQLWIDAAADEAVTAPMMKMASVNGTARGIDFKPGESTLGNSCVSYFITEEDKDGGIEYPLFLKQSDEILKKDTTYVYEKDENGEFVLDENGEKVVSEMLVEITYKLEFDDETVAEAGDFGEHPFNAEDGLTIDANSDVDGDGYVTIWAQTLSSTGAFSDIVELKVSVGEIQLNSPSLALVAVNGLNRSYKINWANNTLCGEPFTFKFEGDNGNAYQDFEENAGVGEIITFKESGKVTVSAPGYLDGVIEAEADFLGKDISRKNADAEDHDWNFVNISEEMYQQFNGQIVASYEEYITTGEGDEAKTDTIAHSIAEYEAAEEAGTDVSGWAPVAQSFGWWLPIASNRTTLNVVEGGIDQNDNGFGYEEEQIGIFKGFTVSCPPNANNASCIFKYIDKADGNELGSLGVYFMARPTLTFERDAAVAGELVEIYYGQGGSNYTTSTTHAMYEVPTDGPLTVQLPNGGVHVFYIDIYTYNDLPADEYATSVASTQSSAKATVAGYYSLSGAKISAPQKGINIVKMSDGSVKKMLVK